MSGVKVLGTKSFEVFAAKCREAGSDGKGLQREIRRALKDGAEPVAEDARQNVMALSSQGGRGGARAARTAFAVGKRKKKLSEAAKAKIHGGTGLRSSAARATKVTVTMGGNTAKAEIKVNASLMPASQRKLPRHMNTGRWRHPVMGNPDNWVTQTVEPPRWFDRAMDKGGPKVREEAFNTVKKFLDRF
jgi:DNA-binding protein YbaB